MHKGVYADRLLKAQKGLLDIVRLAVVEGVLDASFMASIQTAQRERNPDIRALYELEAIGPAFSELALTAVTLEELVRGAGESPHGPTLAEIVDIPGLSKTSRNAINDYFESLKAQADQGEAEDDGVTN